MFFLEFVPFSFSPDFSSKINFLETLHTFIYYPYGLRQGNSEFFYYYIKICQINYILKMYRIFEVLRLVDAVFRTASVVQTANKYSLYGHLLPI